MSATGTHDVVIGGVGYLVKPGSYRKAAAPLMGSRFTTGSPDYTNLGPMQHWVQSCWVGGIGQETWDDDAMFDEAVGVDTSIHERMQLTRDLKRGAGAGWGIEQTMGTPRQFVVFRDVLYVLTSPVSGSGQLWVYSLLTDGWSLIKTFTASLTYTVVVWQGFLLVGSAGGYLHKWDGVTWSQVTAPTGETGIVYSLASFRDRLYVAFKESRAVWRLKPDMTWDGTTVFYVLPESYVVAFETHLGFLYMLSYDGTIFRTDGNNSGEVWRADPGANGLSMRSYDGRLFVMLREAGAGGTQSESALYQLSGSAMTELKRWGKPGKVVTAAGRMVVNGGRLYYGASGLLGMANGFGVAVYDAVEDAHSIFCTSVDTVVYPDGSGNGVGWTVDDVCVYAGYLFVAVRDHGVFRTPFTFRDYAAGRETATYDVTSGTFGGGWLVSSAYDAGIPGLQKLWASVKLEVEVPAPGCEVHFDLAVDGGSWVNDVGSAVFVAGSSGRRRLRISLGDLRGTVIRYRLRLVSTSSASTPVVYAVAFSYLLVPDPQWRWEMTLVVSERQELLDGTTVEVDPGVVIAALEGRYRSMALVTFIDIDGTTWTNGAIFTDLSEVVYLTAAPVEGEVRVVLLEAVEG